NGLAALRDEKGALETERRALEGDAAETVRQRDILTGRLRDLVERIARAQVVDPKAVDREDVRFGATVTLRRSDGSEQTLQIVGVDEAAVRDDAVAFTSPVARAVHGKRSGETATLRSPRGNEPLDVLSVVYD
ncbi:MAG: GreA/GreB family elongation factor, partial [Bacteroidota bacterium]